MKDKQLEKVLAELVRAQGTEQPKAFRQYCLAVIGAKEAGDLSIGEASYKICGAVSVFNPEGLSDLDEVVDIACDLELPQGQRMQGNQDDQKSWDRLKTILTT